MRKKPDSKAIVTKKNLRRFQLQKMDASEIGKITELNKRIIDNAPISIMTIDKKGNITFVNDYFKQLSGSRDPLHRNIFNLPFFIKEQLCPDYKKLLSKGISFKKEGCYTRNIIGKPKYINIVAVPLRSADGKIDGALSMATDATEAISANIKLGELNTGLELKIMERTHQLFETNERLNRSLESKLKFIADASHELRTPLTIIKLNMDLNKRELKDKKQEPPKIFKTIDREIDKITEILSDLSLQTSIDENNDKINFNDVELNGLIAESLERLNPLAKERKIKVLWKNRRARLVVKGDKMKLDRLFSNIVRNAIKYGRPKGWIKIWGEKDSNNKVIKINIQDNGIGIPQKDLPNIFDRFYRADVSRIKGEGGFGLGLSICKWIAEQHNGFISADSVVSQGSHFIVNLPIYPEVVKEETLFS